MALNIARSKRRKMGDELSRNGPCCLREIAEVFLLLFILVYLPIRHELVLLCGGRSYDPQTTRN